MLRVSELKFGRLSRATASWRFVMLLDWNRVWRSSAISEERFCHELLEALLLFMGAAVLQAVVLRIIRIVAVWAAFTWRCVVDSCRRRCLICGRAWSVWRNIRTLTCLLLIVRDVVSLSSLFGLFLKSFPLQISSKQGVLVLKWVGPPHWDESVTFDRTWRSSAQRRCLRSCHARASSHVLLVKFQAVVCLHWLRFPRVKGRLSSWAD